MLFSRVTCLLHALWLVLLGLLDFMQSLLFFSFHFPQNVSFYSARNRSILFSVMQCLLLDNHVIIYVTILFVWQWLL